MATFHVNLVCLLPVPLPDRRSPVFHPSARPPQASRLLGSACEDHPPNQAAVRQAGGVAALARLLVAATELPDLSALASLRLLPAVAQAAHALAALCRDCPDNAAAALVDSDLLLALQRLMQVTATLRRAVRLSSSGCVVVGFVMYDWLCDSYPAPQIDEVVENVRISLHFV